jgi:hypothetical protein
LRPETAKPFVSRAERGIKRCSERLIYGLIYGPTPFCKTPVSVETRKKLLPYIRPVYADLSPLALMNSACLDLITLSAS